jgi:uncharacterized RDD family membrane protein YckC/tRNA A-37 threonylcarbamoyl transferase component Bud32
MSALKAEAFETTLRSDSGPRFTPRPGETDRWIGARLDHFEVDRLLARGGMGAVYKAHDQSLDRDVAVKVLPAELAHHPELQERFIREARAQARLNSPHVVHIYYIGRTPAADAEPASLFFAMELVEGGALERVLDQGKVLAAEDARKYMIQVAEGLRDAEQAGIIHRDIKPGNLLLDPHGYIKIADFGVAKPIRETDSKITQDGAVVGSPLYMAPEQAKGEPLDHRADMYALGCTFFHLLAGAAPFDGPTALAVVSKHLSSPPPELSTVLPGAPKALSAIILRLMQKEPSDRYASYDALIADLESAAPQAVQYGGFWVRGAAVGIDMVLAGTLIGLLGWLGLVLHLAYVTVAQARYGRTVGKYLLGLKVQRTDGGALGFGRSLGRTLASLWLPFLVGLVILLTQGRGGLLDTINEMQPSQMESFKSFLIAIAIGNGLLTLLYLAGLALAAFHPQKRAAHDLVAGSEVVYRLRAA